tara:strand:+ start:3151 stop:4776 length:1626 start_codon:yes stop_codon:yes gene_type:complete
MGADQYLIRAAGGMAPQPFDYSGIMLAIKAMGQYSSAKNGLADEMVTYGAENFNINEMPKEIFTGTYGDQNMNFITKAKDDYYKAVNVTRRTPSWSKKYKNAIKKINSIKSMFEKNKADAVKWASMQGENANKAWRNRSAGIGFDAENRLADIVLNPYTNKMNSDLIMTEGGIMVQQPTAGGNDPLNPPQDTRVDIGGERYVTMGGEIQTELINISDIMQGYKENLAYKKIKLDDGTYLNMAEEVEKIILKYGKTAKLGGRGDFEERLFRNELTLLFQKIKRLGPDALRSLAYDYENGAKGGTFVQKNSKNIMGYDDEEWVELVQQSFDEGSNEKGFIYNDMASADIDETKTGKSAMGEEIIQGIWQQSDANMMSPTPSTISQMKKQILSSAFATNNYDVLETSLMDWLEDISREQWETTKPNVIDDRNSIVMATNKRIYKQDFNTFVNIMSGKSDDPTRTVNLGGDTYRYVKQTKDWKDDNGVVHKLKDKMAWESNYNGVYEPIPPRANGSAGSGRSLHSLLNNRSEFDFLLNEDYNPKL